MKTTDVGGKATLRGFDSPVDCSKVAAKAKAAGFDYIARYFGPATSRNKKLLDRKEAMAITLPGLQLVSIFEGAGNVYKSFTPRKGTTDAQTAVDLAKKVGQPQGSAIYFCVDFDASAIQVAEGVTAYFKSVKKVMDAAGYKVGVYGSGSTCSAIKGGKLAAFAMLACASGWRGSRVYKGADIRQGLPTKELGIPVDPEATVRLHEGFGDFGAWTIARRTPVTKQVAKAGAAQLGFVRA